MISGFTPGDRSFRFERDTFAFANELVCEYRFDPASGRAVMTRRTPRPEYVLRCFVLVRAARQFHLHGEFRPEQPPVSEAEYVLRVRQLIARSARQSCRPEDRVGFPGFDGLRSFSRSWEELLKARCGRAWRSYVLRSHWRMVFPITRRHQERTADRLVASLAGGGLPIVHLVRFPQLTINHGMLLFGVAIEGGLARFDAYDPNDPAQPARLTYERATRTFHLPANRYWAGGALEVIEIYRTWWF